MAPPVLDAQTYGWRLREPRISLRSIRGSRVAAIRTVRQCVSEVNVWLIVWLFLFIVLDGRTLKVR
jgi:hypothetical protein